MRPWSRRLAGWGGVELPNEAVPLGRARWSPEDVVGSNPAVAKCALMHADMHAHARRYKHTHTHSLARTSKRLNLCKFA